MYHKCSVLYAACMMLAASKWSSHDHLFYVQIQHTILTANHLKLYNQTLLLHSFQVSLSTHLMTPKFRDQIKKAKTTWKNSFSMGLLGMWMPLVLRAPLKFRISRRGMGSICTYIWHHPIPQILYGHVILHMLQINICWQKVARY